MKVDTEALEQWIDADGGWNVALALEIVLSEKAEHIRENWQDNKSARLYDKFSRHCGKLAREMEQANI